MSELKTRKVLTVNQTFDILLKWVETRDWEQALYAVVPKRKFEKDEEGIKAEDSDVEKVVVGVDVVEEDESNITGEAMLEAARSSVYSQPSMSIDPELGTTTVS